MYLFGYQWVANRSTYPRKSKSSFTTSTINRPKWAQTFLQMRNVDTSSVSQRYANGIPCERSRSAHEPGHATPSLLRALYYCHIAPDLITIRLSHWTYIRAREHETCDIFAAGFSLKSIAHVFVRWTRVVRFESCVLENFNVIWLQVDRM